MIEVKNVKFSLVDSANPKYVEVVATYSYNGKLEHHYMFLNKKKNYTKADYLKEARTVFNEDNKRNLLGKKGSSFSTRRGLVVATTVLAACTLALGGFLTYKLLDNGGEITPEIVTYKANAEVNNKDEVNNSYGVKLEKSEAKSHIEFATEIQLIKPSIAPTVEWCLPAKASDCIVKVDNKTLSTKDYTYTKNSTGNLANLTIPADKVTGDILISVTLVKIEKPVVDIVNIILDSDALKVFVPLSYPQNTATKGKNCSIELTAIVAPNTSSFKVYVGKGLSRVEIPATEYQIIRSKVTNTWTLTINGQYITDDITIHATPQEKPPVVKPYTISCGVPNLSLDSSVLGRPGLITDDVIKILTVNSNQYIQDGSLVIRRTSDDKILVEGEDFSCTPSPNQIQGVVTYELKIFLNAITGPMAITSATLIDPPTPTHSVAVNIKNLLPYTNLFLGEERITQAGVKDITPVNNKITFQTINTGDDPYYINSTYIDITDSTGQPLDFEVIVVDNSSTHGGEGKTLYDAYSITITVPSDITDFSIELHRETLPDVGVHLYDNYNYFMFRNYDGTRLKPFDMLEGSNKYLIRYRNGYSSASNLAVKVVSGGTPTSISFGYDSDLGGDYIEIKFTEKPTSNVYLQICEPTDIPQMKLSQTFGTGTNDIYLYDITTQRKADEVVLAQYSPGSRYYFCIIKSDTISSFEDWNFYIPGFPTEDYTVTFEYNPDFSGWEIGITVPSGWPKYNLTLAADKPAPTSKLQVSVVSGAFDSNIFEIKLGETTLLPGTTTPIDLVDDKYVDLTYKILFSTVIVKEKSFNLGDTKFTFMPTNDSSGTIRVVPTESFTIYSVTMIKAKNITTSVSAGSEKFDVYFSNKLVESGVSILYAEGEPTIFKITSKTTFDSWLGLDRPLYQLDLNSSKVQVTVGKKIAEIPIVPSEDEVCGYKVVIPNSIDITEVLEVNLVLVGVDARAVPANFLVSENVKDRIGEICTQDGIVISNDCYTVDGTYAPITSNIFTFYLKTDLKNLVSDYETYLSIVLDPGTFVTPTITPIENSYYNYKIQFAIADNTETVAINFFDLSE